MSPGDFTSWLDRHLFSPTELDNYRRCPFRFYAESYRGLKPPPEREIDLSPQESGELIHRILANHRPGDSSPLLKKGEAILEKFAQERPGLSRPLFEVRRKRILETVGQFLQAEEARSLPLRLERTEWGFGNGSVPPLEMSGVGRPIRIRGRVDRIDVDHRGRCFLVIDYKTGSETVSGAAITRGEALQLPLYLLAVGKLFLPGYEPVGALYYRLSDMSLQSGVLHKDRLPEGLPEALQISPRSTSLLTAAKWEALFETIRRTVEEIVGSIRQGHFVSTPDACRPNCPYRDLCRISPNQIATSPGVE